VSAPLPDDDEERRRRDDPVRDALRQLLLLLVLIGTVSGVIGASRGAGFFVVAGVCLLAAIACVVLGVRRMNRR